MRSVYPFFFSRGKVMDAILPHLGGREWARLVLFCFLFFFLRIITTINQTKNCEKQKVDVELNVHTLVFLPHLVRLQLRLRRGWSTESYARNVQNKNDLQATKTDCCGLGIHHKGKTLLQKLLYNCSFKIFVKTSSEHCPHVVLILAWRWI